MVTADEIQVIIINLRRLVDSGKTQSQIDEMPEYESFRKSNRMFYEMILSDPNILNSEILAQMLKMKRKLESGEDQYSVDVKFGQYMANKYIDPVIKK